jgi:hypothetical protein
MSKRTKILLTVVILLGGGYLIYRGYERRWQVFNQDGNTQWGNLGGATRYPGKFAIRAAQPNHGIKASNIITIESNSRYANADYKVLEVLELADGSWIVTNQTAKDGEDITGRFKLVKRS